MTSLLKHNSFFQSFLLMATIIAAPSLSVAQQYKSIKSDREAYFTTSTYNMERYGESLNFCNYTNCLLGIRVDSISQDSQTLHFPVYARGNEFDGICPSASWLGPKIDLLASGAELLYNGVGDSIFLSPTAALGENWNMFTFPNNDFISATVVNITAEEILGTVDSVKEVVLQLKDINGNELPHIFNGFQLKIGKEMGLIRTCDFFHFPNDNTVKMLVGLSNPAVGIQLLDTKSIFNYEVGQELHSKRECSVQTDFSYSDWWKKQIILDKDSSTTSYSYLVDRTYYSRWGAPMESTADTLFYRDTFSFSVPTNNLLFDSHPFELHRNGTEPSGFNFNFLTSTISSRQKLEVRNDFFSDVDNGQPDCLLTFIDNDAYRQYMACKGQAKSYQFSFPTSCNGNLVYSKKGDEIWGSPINFNHLLNPVSELNHESNLYEIAPNPAISVFSVTTKSTTQQITSWKLYNSYGILQKQAKNLMHSQLHISIGSLHKGMHFLQIVNTKGQLFSYPIIVL